MKSEVPSKASLPVVQNLTDEDNAEDSHKKLVADYREFSATALSHSEVNYE